MSLGYQLLVDPGSIGPRFMDPVVLLGIAAAIVMAVGTALLVAYAIIAGVLRRRHR